MAWNPLRTANHHIGLFGGSGSGKTHLLKHFIANLPDDVEVDLLDYHGDVSCDFPGAETCLFSEQTRWGLQPINPQL